MSTRALLCPMLLTLCAMPAFAATANEPTKSCPHAQNQRPAVVETINDLGNKLALGRLCRVQETTLHELKHQTLNRYAGCLQSLQFKATEIQDALEVGRTLARDTFKQAKNKVTLCEQVRLATN